MPFGCPIAVDSVKLSVALSSEMFSKTEGIYLRSETLGLMFLVLDIWDAVQNGQKTAVWKASESNFFCEEAAKSPTYWHSD